jgi:outer membrane murein-binding lipoprotein Lpp
MDAEQMRQHLTGRAQQGPAGPAAGAEMTALSVVSTDVGRLSAQLEELRGRVDALAERTEAVTADRARLDDLTAQLDALHGQVLALEEADRDRTPPPQPWDWAGMEEAERADAVAQLRTWVGEVLAYWWPAAASRLPECWTAHPQLLQDISLLYVSYQQAYEHPSKRVHHGTDFRHLLIAVAESAPGLVTRSECEHQHPHLMPSVRAAQAQQALRDIVLLMSYASGEIDGDRLPQHLRDRGFTPDQAKEHAAELFATHGITQEEYRAAWDQRRG